jgi:aspartate ammonia-lyase
MGQSTNDVLPAAVQLATHDMITRVADSVAELVQVTGLKAAEFADVVKLGRTCLQDALPVTLGQEFSGYRDMLARQEGRLRALGGDLLVLGLGGTAVGTGVGTLPGFVPTVYELLRSEIGLPVDANPNLFDAMQNADVYLQASAAMKSLACGLSKMSSDLRIMSSGPRGGLAEIVLPPVLPGSSIMPGKVNPALPELMIQIYFQVCGNDLAITLAVERGELELNVWEAVVHKNLAEAAQLLAAGTKLFAERCVAGITANRERNRSMATSSLALAAVVSAVHGYEVGTEVAVNAASTRRSIHEVAEERGLFSHEAATELLDPMSLVDATSMANLLAGQRSPDQDAARQLG